MNKYEEMIDQYLKKQNISEEMIEEIRKFRNRYETDPLEEERMQKPAFFFYGKDILEMAIAAILQEKNLLLSGAKATGKNILCETLAWIFGRPSYDISFHINMDSTSLIGTDTFRNNEVSLRKGPIYQCAECGGFGIMDEINMAKNEAVAVLHATLDHRRRIDVPGYSRITLHPATRFIGTMNFGYAGTRELNEALVSRFMVIDMPPLNEEILQVLLEQYFPTMKREAREQFAGIFLDLQTKCYNGEIGTKSLDLRGLIGAIETTKSGLTPSKALQMGIINKSFDAFEKEIIEDVIATRIPTAWTKSNLWE